MSTHSGPFVDPMDIVHELTALPHRGATTDQARSATDILERHLRQLGATVPRLVVGFAEAVVRRLVGAKQATHHHIRRLHRVSCAVYLVS
jgi:hypothetical protein